MTCAPATTDQTAQRAGGKAVNSPMRRVLLAGATGYIGRAVAVALAERNYEIIAVTRSTTGDLPVNEQVRANVTDAAELRRALRGVHADAVISCIASRTGVAADAWAVDYTANCNLLSAVTGARHFTLLSAICVQRPRLAFQRAKLAFEEKLRAADIGWSIVRPTAFFKSLSGQVGRVRQGKPFLVFGTGSETACKPIAERDLAHFIVDSLSDPTLRNRILPIGGPGPAMTPRQQGELLFELANLEPQFRQVSPALFSAALAVLAPLGKLIPAAATKAELARIGRYYATESMLLWDADAGRYDADATPSTGTVTLRDHYAQVLRDGLDDHAPGAQKLFR